MISEKMHHLGSNRNAIRELFEFGQVLKKEVGAENVYDFSLGNPTVSTPNAVKEVMIDILSNEWETVHSYTSAQGDYECREVIANHFSALNNSKVTADNFYLTCGAASSLVIMLKSILVKKEDEVIIFAPYFPEYTVFVDVNGGTPVIIPADTKDFQINFDILEKSINKNTRAVIINSPNNPTGAVYTEETIIRLSNLLKEKNKEFNTNILIISDEPYREVVYDDTVIHYVPDYYSNTVICYSFSKSLSLPGERIGYICVPDEVNDSKNLYLAVLGSGRALGYICAPTLFQKTIARCLGQTGDISIYKENRDLLYENLTEIGFECFKPAGAFYLFMESIGNSTEFSAKAKDFNLLLVDAKDFGCEGYIRISYCVDKEMIKKSIPAFSELYKSFQ